MRTKCRAKNTRRAAETRFSSFAASCSVAAIFLQNWRDLLYYRDRLLVISVAHVGMHGVIGMDGMIRMHSMIGMHSMIRMHGMIRMYGVVGMRLRANLDHRESHPMARCIRRFCQQRRVD